MLLRLQCVLCVLATVSFEIIVGTRRLFIRFDSCVVHGVLLCYKRVYFNYNFQTRLFLRTVCDTSVVDLTHNNVDTELGQQKYFLSIFLKFCTSQRPDKFMNNFCCQFATNFCILAKRLPRLFFPRQSQGHICEFLRRLVSN